VRRRRQAVAFVQGGYFDFIPHLDRGLSLPSSQLRWRISDHYPWWVEILTLRG
jgi:hypothetical protein